MRFFSKLFGKQEVRSPEKEPAGPEEAAALQAKNVHSAKEAEALLANASSNQAMYLAMALLMQGNSEVRKSVAVQVGALRITAMGVAYELANVLADYDEGVRSIAAQTFWTLNSVDYAIRSLRDEYETPNKMTSRQALRGIAALRATSADPQKFHKLLHANWEGCPERG